jgi:hypothetical protein
LENPADLVNLASENGPDREPVSSVSVRALEIGDLRAMLHYANSSSALTVKSALTNCTKAPSEEEEEEGKGLPTVPKYARRLVSVSLRSL